MTEKIVIKFRKTDKPTALKLMTSHLKSNPIAKNSYKSFPILDAVMFL